MSGPESESRSGISDRFLRIFADVRPGEATTALILSLNIFLLLSCYYIIKPVRDGLILAMPGGAELKSYASAASAVLMLGLVPLYSMLVNRLDRKRLITGVTIFFVACLCGFYLLSQNDAWQASLAIPFYLWVSVFNMMAPAQFWGFANDVYDKDRGQRLFPVVGVGQSLGALAGTFLVVWLPTLKGIDVYTLMLFSAGLLLSTVGMTWWVDRRESKLATLAMDGAEKPEEAVDKSGGFSLVFQSRYLLLLAAFHLVFTLVNSNGEYILGSIVADAANANPELVDATARRTWMSQFYGKFYMGVNLMGLVLQSFVVSRIVKHGGLRIAFFVLPTIAFMGSGLAAIFPLLGVIRIAKTVENSTDYSLNNTIRHMLWLPTTKAMKYKAKQAVDTFFVRMGDVASGALVWLGASVLAFEVRFFALANVLFCALWVVLAIHIVRAYREMAPEEEQ